MLNLESYLYGMAIVAVFSAFCAAVGLSIREDVSPLDVYISIMVWAVISIAWPIAFPVMVAVYAGIGVGKFVKFKKLEKKYKVKGE